MIFWVFIFLFISYFNTAITKDCPCENSKDCEIIDTWPKREVFMFSLDQGKGVSWKNYDWEKLTSVVMVGYNNSEMMCHAHSLGKRVIKIANIKGSLLADPIARNQWIQSELQFVKDNFLDGINVDFEEAIDINETVKRNGLSQLMKETYQMFKSVNDNYQVSYDVAWAPNIDLRYFNYSALAQYTDFLFVMAYDEQSQIFGPCIAGPNSPIAWAEIGLRKYQDLGIPNNKLILGVPWYGYIYPCQKYYENSTCTLKEVPFRGVNCSDAAGKEINYSYIVHTLLPHSFSGRIWDDEAKSPFFTIKDASGNYHQIRYDDKESLTFKYNLASKLGLRGVGVWNIDAVDYSIEQDIEDMWGIL